jgi:nucleoside-triphosphatase THEP1
VELMEPVGPMEPARRSGLIYVVTGEKGAGKSTVCSRVARGAAERGLSVGGILTERGGAEGPRPPRRVVDLRSGESRPFGSQDRAPGRGGAATAPTPTTDPLTPGWEFESGVLPWVNEVLERATPCDLLVIDELGPLELLGGRGWTKALSVLRRREYAAALVACRPSLLEVLTERLSPYSTDLFEVTPQERDDLPAAILAELPACLTPVRQIQAAVIVDRETPDAGPEGGPGDYEVILIAELPNGTAPLAFAMAQDRDHRAAGR